VADSRQGRVATKRRAAEGFFNANPLHAYSINSVTGTKGADGAITIQFGDGSKETPNCLPVT
jgi:hypothetical protein